MEFPNFIKANKHASTHREKANTSGTILEDFSQYKDIDPSLHKYFFDHQFKIEKSGNMDYHVYARTIWEQLIGEITPDNQKSFESFENSMIIGLHNIDMTPHVYDHVTESLAGLIAKYQKSVKNVALWSTGDVEATGYQIEKINRSKIIMSYYKALKSELPKEEAGKIMREKTSYMVADNKFKGLAEYSLNAIEKNPNEKIKIVILEDSRGNFDKAPRVLAEALGDKASQVEIIPIWATYSREGQQAESKAVSSYDATTNLIKQKENLNAINTFRNLLDENRFGPIFEGAHVFVDFDGVVGNNISMRDEQAKVIYNALMTATISNTGLTEKEISEDIKSKINSLEK